MNFYLSLSAVNKYLKRIYVARLATSAIRIIVLSIVVAGVWGNLRPQAGLEQILLTLLCFSVGLLSLRKEKRLQVDEAKLFTALEVKNPQVQLSAFSLSVSNPSSVDQVWAPLLQNEFSAIKSQERRNLLSHFSTLFLPTIFLVCISVFTPTGVSAAFANAKRVLVNFSWGVSLKIVDGKAKEEDPDVYRLSSSYPSSLELISENLIEINLTHPFSEDKFTASLELRKTNNGKTELFQSFQLSADQSSEANSASIAFSVSESVSLYIPELSSSPLANIVVKQLPYPKVDLAVIKEIENPWPDDQPLALAIDVNAENPLRLVRLVILSGKKKSEELVSNVLAEDLNDLSTTYDLILEPYVESDIAEVEIYAEAVDRSLPKALLGRSPSIKVRTASAYGRYRQTLETLRQLKNSIDEVLQDPNRGLGAKEVELISTAEKQSENSPFFDGLDRVTISSFHRDISEVAATQNDDRFSEISERLNHFLFEHEVLDDRERDRDFFVAIRTFARLLEKSPEKRPVSAEKTVDRIKNFLNDREKRWSIRVSRLPAQYAPPSWPHISQRHPFHQGLENVASLDAKQDIQSRSESLVQLSQLTARYREWIEELEKLEDQNRQEAEKKRQQGLSSARDKLRELQQRQGEISQQLDHADRRSSDELKENWPSVQMKQNSNISETKEVEANLRALAPSASERIKLAIESMGIANTAGSSDNFIEAESASDMAGRLLRQAESAAQRAQQSQPQRGARRRVTGDRYYGQPIFGGDHDGDVEFQRDYQVDRKYREVVLDEVQESISDQGESDGSEKRYMEEYLRQIIR